MKIRYFEIKKLTLFFLLNQVPFNGKDLNKQKGPRTSNQLIFRLQSKFKNIPSLVMYHLTKFDHVTCSGFWVIPKTTFAALCKPIHDIVNYSTFIGSFESRKCEKEGKNYKKNCISQKRKDLFGRNKMYCS